MKIYSLETGKFKLDGGAMFGVVPKSIWQRTNPADDKNLCSWSMRSLLIQDGEKLILIDTGLGNKQDQRFLKHYYLHGEDTLTNSITQLGYHPDEITDVILTHLHFDHCGGAIKWNNDKTFFEPTFKNATYWSNELHWKWATEPNPREKASFLSQNILPIQESGQLKFIERKGDYTSTIFDNIDLLFVDGHTDSQMIPHISYNDKTIVFCADLLPSTGHIPLPFVMGYDTRPLLTLSEKDKFLKNAAEKEYILFLQHDYYNEVCIVHKGEKRIEMKESIPFLNDLI